MCTTGGYTYDLGVYCGNDSQGNGNATANIVFSLLNNLLDTGRKVYTDNYYTSVSLASRLLTRQTHLIGTVRANRKLNAQDVLNKKLKKHGHPRPGCSNQNLPETHTTTTGAKNQVQNV